MLPPDMSDIKQNVTNLRCAVVACIAGTISWACCTLAYLRIHIYVWIACAASVLVPFVLDKLEFHLCIM